MKNLGTYKGVEFGLQADELVVSVSDDTPRHIGLAQKHDGSGNNPIPGGNFVLPDPDTGAKQKVLKLNRKSVAIHVWVGGGSGESFFFK